MALCAAPDHLVDGVLGEPLAAAGRHFRHLRVWLPDVPERHGRGRRSVLRRGAAHGDLPDHVQVRANRLVCELGSSPLHPSFSAECPTASLP